MSGVQYDPMGIMHAIQPEIVEFLVSPVADTALAWLAEADLGEPNQLALLERPCGVTTPPRKLVHCSRWPVCVIGQRSNFQRRNECSLRPRPSNRPPITWWPKVHAAWLDRYAPAGTLLDLGCGIGGDLLALARFRQVIAYERDPLRAQLALANVRAIGLEEQVEVRIADWVEEMTCGGLPDAAGAFVDPSRRVAGRRVFSLERMEPSLTVLRQLQSQKSRCSEQK